MHQGRPAPGYCKDRFACVVVGDIRDASGSTRDRVLQASRINGNDCHQGQIHKVRPASRYCKLLCSVMRVLSRPTMPEGQPAPGYGKPCSRITSLLALFQLGGVTLVSSCSAGKASRSAKGTPAKDRKLCKRTSASYCLTSQSGCYPGSAPGAYRAGTLFKRARPAAGSSLAKAGLIYPER